MLDIHVVSHTHWDREWYLTQEQFRFRLVALIDHLLDLLDADPAYKYFHLDGQTIVLEDYLEIRPEQEPRLRRAIEAGRILIGPWYVMPDEFLVTGESLVRNLARGHRISRQFGTPMPVGYLPDLFGHVAQMPQIWRQFGLDNTILWRGFGGTNAEYWWEAPDGSRVLMMHLPPEGYCNATRLVFDPGAMMARAAKAVDYERRRSRVDQVLLMNGVDHVEPHAAIPMLIDKLSSIPGQHARHSTLPAYVAAVRTAVETSRLDLETVVGELRGGTDYANLLPGVLSARVYLKQQNAHVQTLLESYAEPLSVFASIAARTTRSLERERPENLKREPFIPRLTGDAGRRAEPFRYPAGELRHAWKTLLQNHPHDSICGCSVDAVHDENMTRFARARQVADTIVEHALDAIADSVRPALSAVEGPALSGVEGPALSGVEGPAPPGAIRAIVVNPDASGRAQVVEASIDLPVDSAEPWRVVDAQALDRPVVFWPREAAITAVVGADGQRVAFQVLGEEPVVSHVMSRYETPWALNVHRVRLLWWAPSLPPCGYAAFDLEVGTSGTSKEVPYDEVPYDTSGTSKEVPYEGITVRRAPLQRCLVTATERSADNEWLTLSVNGDGTFDVTAKATGMTYRRAAALEDVGDVGDEYSYCPPASDRRVTTSDARVTGISRVCTGALRAAFRVDLELPLPLAAGLDRRHRAAETVAMPVSIEATLDAGSPRVVFTVTVDNRASDHRLRILFPTGASQVETARADTAFDLVSRTAQHEIPPTVRNEAPVNSAPLISLVDAGDARAGATVIAKGLMEYEIVRRDENGEETAIALTLIRAVSDLSRNDLATRPSGHAGPPVATPAAQCLGRHQFEAAFEPRSSAPAAGALFASARAHTIQPRVVVARRPDGTGATARSFLRVDSHSGDLVLSALKQADDGASVIVRLFNPGDEEAQAVLALDAPAVHAFAVNFLEERQAVLAVNDATVTVRLRPHQIQTIEIVPE